MPPVWGDLYKPIKDLLTKNYNGDTHKFELKRTDAAVTLNPTLTRNVDGSILGNSSVELDKDVCSKCHVVAKAGINTNGLLTTKVTLDKLVYPGLKFEGIADKGEKSKDVYEIKAEYKQAALAFTTLVNLKGGQAVSETTAVFNYKDFNFGGSAAYNITKQAQGNINYGATYNVTKDTTLAAIVEGNKLKLGAITAYKKYFFGVENLSSIADLKDSVTTVGLETKLADGQIVKARTNTLGVFGLSLQHALSSEIKVIGSLEWDTKNNSSKVGTQIVFTGL